MNEAPSASNRETQLWYWLLYSGVMPTMHAKKLLDTLCSDGATLETVLRSSPGNVSQPAPIGNGLETLRPPQYLAAINALRWNESLYPKGLLQLELSLRPALLFYRGDPSLLSRPVLIIPPAPVEEAAMPLLHEAAGLLLGETLLPAALRDTNQAAALLEELSTSEGEVVLFVRQGLDTIQLSQVEEQLFNLGRLLMLSPLAAGTGPNARWDASLGRVELAIAAKALWISATPPAPPIPDTQTLWLTPQPPSSSSMPGLQITSDPADIPMWLLDNAIAEDEIAVSDEQDTTQLPPLPPNEALRVLERGGYIPEALRRRLLGQ